MIKLYDSINTQRHTKRPLKKKRDELFKFLKIFRSLTIKRHNRTKEKLRPKTQTCTQTFSTPTFGRTQFQLKTLEFQNLDETYHLKKKNHTHTHKFPYTFQKRNTRVVYILPP